jgi:hypothetical protein
MLCPLADNNWSITHLRPSNTLRPCIASSQSSSQLKYELSTKRPQPTYEEDALVLRVIEAYSIAFQNTSRNTIHSGELMIYNYFKCFFKGEKIMLLCLP